MNQGVIWFLPFEEQLIVWLQHLGEGTILQTILFYLNNFFSFLGEEIICIAVMGFVYWGLDKKRGERIGAGAATQGFGRRCHSIGTAAGGFCANFQYGIPLGGYAGAGWYD